MITESELPDPMEHPIPVRYYPNRFRSIIHWSITGRCNYRCKHCFQSANEGVLGEPTLDQCLDMIRQFKDCGIHHVDLTGGEPLIRKDFWQIVDALREADIFVGTIYSNGKLIDQALFDGFKARGMHPGFQISFDGVGHHDWFRGVPGAEKAAINAMKLIKENGSGFNCAMCLCRNNMHTISETAELLASLGCSGLKISRASMEGQWRNHPELALSDDELLQLYQDYIEEYYEQEIQFPIQLEGIADLHPVKHTKPGRQSARVLFEMKYTEDQLEHRLICGILGTSFFVGPNGAVVPCMSLCGAAIEPRFPNLFETPLCEILSESCYTRLSEAKISELIQANEKCVSCEHRRNCIGGKCRAMAIGDRGTDYFMTNDFMCYIFKSNWRERIKSAVNKANSRWQVTPCTLEEERGADNHETTEHAIR